MKATTIKLDGVILAEIEKIRPPNQPLTSFVKEILHAEFQRRIMQKSGAEYARFLKANEQEALLMDEWESAELVKSPKKSRK
jgi:hypothetical protein